MYSCPGAGPDDCQSITSPPRFGCLNPPINLTSVTSRPLHAVLLPPQAAGPRLLEALAAALDGSGPAILPLDPTLPRARIGELIAAFAPTTLETAEDSQRLPRAGRGGLAGPGVPDEVAVVLATSGSTGLPKGVELPGSALVASAARVARQARRGTRRAMAVLPAAAPHLGPGRPGPVAAGRIRSRAAGPGRRRRGGQGFGRRGPVQLRLAGADSAAPPARRRGAAGRVPGHPARRRGDPAGHAGRGGGGRGAGGHDLRDDRDLRRLRVRRDAAGRRAGRQRRRRPDQGQRPGAVLRLPAGSRADQDRAATTAGSSPPISARSRGKAGWWSAGGPTT